MRRAVIQWTCDKIACGVVTWTDSWAAMPGGWSTLPDHGTQTHKHYCPNHPNGANR